MPEPAAPPDISLSPRDADILRRLADKVAGLARLPVQEEKRRLWYAHNALQPTRPMIFCDPENGWNEIIPSASLECGGSLAREWEKTLRQDIFWGESMGDDRVVDDVFNVTMIHTHGNWGMQEKITRVAEQGSYCWDPPLKDYAADFSRLRFPLITVDYAASDRLLELAQEALGDILKVRRHIMWWWTLGMTWTLANLRGMEQLMLDMYDHPAELHRLMAFLRDGTLAKLDFLEKNSLLCLNNDNTYVGSGGFGFSRELPQPDFNCRVRTRDLWGFAESQETVNVSPQMFEEFIFPYQLPILERFGLNCYGCCEPLDTRWHVVKRFPRLRRVSVSAWAKVDKMAENLRADYIFSYKPIPTDLAVPVINEKTIREGLRRVIAQTSGCRLEIIMKDNHTLGNNPQNPVRWCRIAREEAERGK